ncbi:hypothetical protein ACB098_01G183300 [Castanea mollissima]|uniref:Uncharacterized protein n=1 Tax=Castanea mollissima TaxID=60419 RepID=A0A8J4RT69_9ROSI|nr:hypothetical protein CMV_003540 [Castanea mollissima]
MELIPKPVQGTLKRYWRRQRYQRLHGSKPVRKNVKITRFGGSPRRRVWRIRAVPKLRLKNFAPLKLWTKIKNAYMNMMVGLAGNVGSLNTSNVFGGKRIPKERQVSHVVYSTEEVENRLILEIYRALIASRELSTK